MLYSKELKIFSNTDVVVCGGGFSGFASAYACAREGVKVVLVEKLGALGGVGTNGLVNHLLGARLIEGDGFKRCVGGIFTEIETQMVKNGFGVDCNKIDKNLNPHGWMPFLSTGLIFNSEEMKRLLEEKLESVGVEIFYYTDIVDVVKDGEKIEGIVVHNKSGLGVINAKQFVDATGDGDICAFSNYPFELGDEEGGLAAASLEMHVDGVDLVELRSYMQESKDFRFRDIIARLKETGVWQFPYEIFISVMLTENDVFMINTIRQVGVNGTDGKSLSRAVIDGRKENYQLLEVMRKYFPGFKNAKIRSIAPMVGIRETRRIISEYVLSVKDLIEGTDFIDSIAMTAYSWDLPHPKKPSLQPYHGVQRKSPYAEIPYRSLIPKGSKNLIAVGRCIGVEREALGAVRVMAPCIAMGEASGIATAMAVKDNLNIGDVDIKKLQQKIINHGGMIKRSHVI